MGQEIMTLTKAEMKKVLVVEKIIDGRMTNREGAAALGLSERQVIRLKKKYQSWYFTKNSLRLIFDVFPTENN